MAKLCIDILYKNSSKRNVIKENHHSNKFLNDLLVGFTKFLHGILSSIWKAIPQHGTRFFLFIWKSQIFLRKECINWRILIWFQRLSSWLSTSLGLHIQPNSELILENWQLASYRKIKYLESNLVCVNVVSMSVGKQHDIAYEISEKVS